MMDAVLHAPSTDPYAGLRGTESILVVDDESLVRNVCTAVLSNAGYRIFSAEGGHLALQMIKAMPSPVHVALLDIRMPRMSGPELVAELLDRMEPSSRDIKFIFMSGYPDPDIQGLAQRDDLRYSFLRKPFTASALQAIRCALDSGHHQSKVISA